MLAVPMPGNVEARRYPDTIEFADVIKKASESRGTARAASQSTVQADRHHFGCLDTFIVEIVESIPQIDEKRFTVRGIPCALGMMRCGPFGPAIFRWVLALKCDPILVCQKIFRIPHMHSRRGFNFPAHRNLRVSEGVENLLR